MLGDGLVMVSLLERRMMYDVMNNELVFNELMFSYSLIRSLTNSLIR